jgi:hypothetical protein
MCEDVLQYFVSDGVYLFKDNREVVFVCFSCYNHAIGKLVQYKRTGESLWEKTDVAYFLNFYFEGDIKSVFLNRDNYDMIGKVGVNFELSEDKEQRYLMRKLKCEEREHTNS